MKKIIYTLPSGGLAVVHPVINTFPKREDITEDQALDRAMKKLPADAIDPRVVDESAIPTDRTFRNAWKAGGGGIEHDMEKAREIHRDRLRVTRAPLLAALDVAYQRADEAGDASAKKVIAEKKQALRDATRDPVIDAAADVGALKAAIPAVLAAA